MKRILGFVSICLVMASVFAAAVLVIGWLFGTAQPFLFRVSLFAGAVMFVVTWFWLSLCYVSGRADEQL